MTGTTAATATQTLAAAEANLQVARNAADRARRDAAAQEVLRLRARIAVLKPALEELAVNTQVATNKRLALHYEIVGARAQIASWSSPLDPLAFPSDATLADRQQQVELWQKRERD